MVGREGLFRASCPPPLGPSCFAAMFKFVPDEFVEPSTIGLKVRNGVNKQSTIQSLTGTPVATYAQLCATDSRKPHAKHDLNHPGVNQSK